MFAKYGTMQNCKLVKDKISGLSVGYGFVKYENDECAQLAIQGMNGKQIGNKRIKVSVARPEGANNKDEKAALFIGGMPKSYTEADLQSLFAAFGLVEEVKIFSDTTTGTSRGSAFVRMDSAASARAVIVALNGKSMQGGTTLTVKEFTPRSKQNDASAAMYGSQVQQYGVYPTSFDQQGYGQGYDMGAYGGYAPAALDPYTSGYGQQDYGNSQQGYGSSQQSGNSLLGFPQTGYDQVQQTSYGYSQPQGYQTSGYGAQTRPSTLSHNRYNPMGGRPQSQGGGQAVVDANNNTLFIFHLPTETTEEALRNMFAGFGVISDLSVVRNKEDGTSRGFGFVTFATHKDAQTAMEQMNGDRKSVV